MSKLEDAFVENFTELGILMIRVAKDQMTNRLSAALFQHFLQQLRRHALKALVLLDREQLHPLPDRERDPQWNVRAFLFRSLLLCCHGAEYAAAVPMVQA